MSDTYRILVVDDEFGMREGVSRVLKPFGHDIATAQNGREAFELIKEGGIDLALIDLRLPDADGLQILDAIQKRDPLTVCIIITAYATLETAVDATKRGAFDYLAKPFTADQLLVVVDRALDRRDLLKEADQLRRERDRSLLELSREQSRFRTIISSMADGVVVTNREGGIVLFNNQGSRFIRDYRTAEPGTPLTERAESPEIIDLVENISSRGGEVSLTGREITLENKTYLANCAALKADDGEFLGTVTVFRDITQLKELEKSKARFVSMVSHELRAPVAAIRGYLDIIIKRAAGDNQQIYDQMMERSRERAEGLLELIKDLLDMSRMDSIKAQRQIKPVDLTKALRDNVEFFAVEMQNRKISCVTELPGESLIALADMDELNRIITNLLSNAVKYNREEGAITISAEREGNRVHFSVADTGIGMTAEEKSHLFEDFYRSTNPLTRKQPGTGLGLSITRRMVESNLGRIDVETEPGKGTKFTVTLPAGS